MSILSLGVRLARQWFPEVAPGPAEAIRPHMAVELLGTVGIARAYGDRIEATIAGEIHATGSHQALEITPDAAGLEPEFGPTAYPVETRVEARCHSSGALAESDPFVWIQLLDDRGSSLTHQTFLGRGVGVEYKVHARIEVAAVMALPATMGSDRARERSGSSRPRLASGLQARIVTRTYGNRSGPRYHMEELGLMLLDAGAALPHVTRSTPAFAC